MATKKAPAKKPAAKPAAKPAVKAAAPKAKTASRGAGSVPSDDADPGKGGADIVRNKL